MENITWKRNWKHSILADSNYALVPSCKTTKLGFKLISQLTYQLKGKLL